MANSKKSAKKKSGRKYGQAAGKTVASAMRRKKRGHCVRVKVAK